RAEDFSGRRVLVAGLGVSGRSAAQVATELGARVTGADCDPRAQERDLPAGVDVIAEADADRLADRALATDPDLIVASPGWNPRTPLLARAQAEVISEVELAWRIAPPQVPWLTLTGTNGKTTTVGMLAAILQAHGWHAPAVGNLGTPIAEEVWRARSSGQELDALAVELSSFQLHYTSTVAPMASACLNVHADHLDWNGGLDAYVADKAKVYQRTTTACIYNTADDRTRQMVTEADVQEGARAIGFSLGTPGPGEVGLVEDVLADRAFVPNRATHAAELGTLADLEPPSGGDVPPRPIANASAAAALAGAAGAEPAAAAAGLRAYGPGPHRMQSAGEHQGVRYIDDSKATNAHAAAAALSAM